MSASDGVADRWGNWYWVEPGRLAAGEYPGASRRVEAERKLAELIDAGITHFVDLTEFGEPALFGRLLPYDDIAKDVGSSRGKRIGWERRPIRDMHIPDSPGEMRAILDGIDAVLERGEAVYVHCRGGKGRTGTVVGCWLVRRGHAGDAALEQVGALWAGIPKSFGCSPERGAQRDLVRGWSEEERAGIAGG